LSGTELKIKIINQYHFVQGLGNESLVKNANVIRSNKGERLGWNI
jgi:hypothetical protein